MKTIVLASQKGGVGKTTLAGHLAVAAEKAGAGPVVVIDTDPQGSLAAWWNAREASAPAFSPLTSDLAGQLAGLAAAGVALVIIDTPPSVSANIGGTIALADLVLIPVRPSPHDLRAVGRTVELVQDAGKPFLFVVSQAKATSRLTAQAIAALSAHGAVAPAIIADRVDYAASMTDGRTVGELNARGPAAGEIASLWQEVSKALMAGAKRRLAS